MPNVIAFDYEFRHPGHGDQSVHNPHKGSSSAYAPGAWKPVSEADATAMRRAIAVDYAEGTGEQYVTMYLKEAQREGATGELFVNGNVQARFPARMSAEDKAHHLKELDQNLAATPKGMLGNPDFPIAVHYAAKGSGNSAGRCVSLNADVPTGGVTIFVKPTVVARGTGVQKFMENEGEHVRIKGDVTFKQINEDFGGRIPSTAVVNSKDPGWDSASPWTAWEHAGQGKSNTGNVLSHEIGHASNVFMSSTGVGEAKHTRTVLSAAKATNSPPLSIYGQKSDGEYYAELFSIWALTGGKTDRPDVRAAAAAAEWRAP